MPQSMETGSFHVRMRFMMRCRMVVGGFFVGAGCPGYPGYPDGPDVPDCPDVLDGPDCPEVPGPPESPDDPEDTTLWFIKNSGAWGLSALLGGQSLAPERWAFSLWLSSLYNVACLYSRLCISLSMSFTCTSLFTGVPSLSRMKNVGMLCTLYMTADVPLLS